MTVAYILDTIMLVTNMYYTRWTNRRTMNSRIPCAACAHTKWRRLDSWGERWACRACGEVHSLATSAVSWNVIVSRFGDDVFSARYFSLNGKQQLFHTGHKEGR